MVNGSFYSKLVRLKVIGNWNSIYQLFILQCFDSKLVRLKVQYTWTDLECAVASTSFLFQTGAIKRSCIIRKEILIQSINLFLFQTGAIKRGYVGNEHEVWVCTFLFQTGAIKRSGLSCFVNPAKLTSFYSKLVRLKGKYPEENIAQKLCFYSKLVRLKVIVAVLRFYFSAFLFQTGAIKSKSTLRLTLLLSEVSIPNWCD